MCAGERPVAGVPALWRTRGPQRDTGPDRLLTRRADVLMCDAVTDVALGRGADVMAPGEGR